MKEKLSIASVVILALFISALKPANQGSVKPVEGNPIPEKLNAVFQNSCKPCHFQGGKFKSTFHLNFSRWDNYSQDKQAQKAKKICSVLMSEDMPPAEARKFRPEIIPTKEQVDAVCKWSETFKVDTEK